MTVSGRPVAQLSPLPSRPQSIAWDDFQRALADSRSDASLARELRELVPDMTDDLDGE